VRLATQAELTAWRISLSNSQPPVVLQFDNGSVVLAGAEAAEGETFAAGPPAGIRAYWCCGMAYHADRDPAVWVYLDMSTTLR
jgi:hypothetical protein